MFANSKLDVLESKLNIYESLSKEMLEKLENAVDKISESNQRIANILTKHDERIDQNARADELMVKMIEGLKEEGKQHCSSVSGRLDTLEKTIDDLLKFRWQAVTIGSVAVLVIGAASAIVPPFIDNMITNHYNGETTTPHVR